MNSPKLYEVALTLIPKIGSILGRQLIQAFGSAEKVFSTPPGKLRSVPGIGKRISDELHHKEQWLRKAHNIIEQCRKLGIQITTITSSDYPYRLKEIPDAPLVLYYTGNLEILNRPAVAIVGTRKPSGYGYYFLDSFFNDLKQYSLITLSGLAYGIDVYAHQKSIDSGIPTAAVLAGGLNQIYPPDHIKIAKIILKNSGLLLTESPPYTQTHPALFPARNRIIAGLSDVVVVVEARKKGGALITARLANDYNREVMAVPGSVFHDTSEGCHLLIKTQQAHLLEQAEDLVRLMGWDLSPASHEEKKLPALSPTERQIIKLLLKAPDYRMSTEALSLHSEQLFPELYASLLQLEVKGVLQAQAGNSYQIIPQWLPILKRHFTDS
ncbi:DNA-processing protein DprA [Thermonema rossianum]|uniref:DNA-processing protein DprA n=1 Tax=Thermonema rossianum TaxID=55505 RepID=UPI00068D921F|nr:DNA-processing protein DprA [Thermonema rossianum]